MSDGKPERRSKPVPRARYGTPRLSRADLEDLRGVSRMAFDAVGGVTGVVERMHATILRRPLPFGRAADAPPKGITGFVYRSVRGVTQALGTGADALLAAAAPLLPEGPRTRGREALVAIANGVYGDYLAHHGNPLAIDMTLRHAGRPVDARNPSASLAAAGAPAPRAGLVIFVHGLCMNDLGWHRNGHDSGAALAAELGRSVLHLRYNSGLHVADNGRRFSELLEQLLGHWPVPVEDLSIVGHSMGGLVARSACHHAQGAGHRWTASLRRLVFLGTPHLGAPLERGGRWLELLLGVSPYSAPLAVAGRRRSAGIKDLRTGTVTLDGSSVPLPRGVQCYAAAATLAKRRGALADRLIGDGLVPLHSALGRARDRTRALRIPTAHRWIGYGMGHIDLLWRPQVHAQLRSWLASSPAR